MTSVGDSEIDSRVAEWLKWDQNEKTRREIQELVARKDVAELRARMLGRLAFGTAGIRAKMEAGFNRLNDLVIIQVTQGMIAHMKAEFPNSSKGIAIGFDGRHNSQRFARLAANAFVLSGIKVYFFKEVTPTPLVSYATIRLNCDAGLMITASHNPKQDNGYKAYWSNGAQILGPHDATICELALQHQEPMKGVWDLSALDNHPLFHDAHTVIDMYFKDAAKFNYYKDINAQSSVKFAYSAFHGVGLKFTPRCLEEFGFKKSNIVLVKEQAEPDPDFPTVPFPNPEEGRQVLEMSMHTADQNGCSIILANDPDADRFQIAEKQPNGEWRILTGNEMGAVLSWWVWTAWRKANPDAKTDDVYFLNSAVSSQIVKTIAAREGFNNRETLTGFKWMGNLAQELRQKGKLMLLAWEESIGFMPGDTLDKDGVLAAAMFAECCAFLAAEGLTLSDQLLRIYKQYGFHLTRNSYFVNRDPAITAQLFTDIRHFGGTEKYPTHIGENSIKFVRDLTVGYDNEQSASDNKPVLPVSRSSEMITFTLSDGSVVTLRASGTEPKIKYYIELKTEPGKEAGDLEQVMAQLNQLETDVIDTLLQPKKYGLEARH